MTLVVEDGTGVPGANSYSDLGAIRLYALQRGVGLPSDDAQLEALVYRSMDYLEGMELGLLSLTFPLDADMLCGAVPTAETLTRLQGALAQLCMALEDGVDLAPVQTGQLVIEETVGPITEKFATGTALATDSQPVIPTVTNLLAPLVAACGSSGGSFKTIRV